MSSVSRPSELLPRQGVTRPDSIALALRAADTTNGSKVHLRVTPSDFYSLACAYTPNSPEQEAGIAHFYERMRIRGLADERENVQKKTFTKWINMHLEKAETGSSVDDLFYDLRDGRVLLTLLELLTGDPVGKWARGRMRIHCLENVDKLLSLLKHAYDVHLENLGAQDIVDGNVRLTLGLVWTLILRFQLQSIGVNQSERCMLATAHHTECASTPMTPVPALAGFLPTPTLTPTRTAPSVTLNIPETNKSIAKEATDALLLWCQVKTAGYCNVEVRNFKSSWRDGLAFNALIHKHRPTLIDFDALRKTNARQNLEQAFSVAEQKLNIARLLDPEDVDSDSADEKSIITYVVTLYHYFVKSHDDTVAIKRAQRVIDQLMEFDRFSRELNLETDELYRWTETTRAKLDERVFEQSVAGLQAQLVQFSAYRTQEKPLRFAAKGKIEAQFVTIQSHFMLKSAQYPTLTVAALRIKVQELDAAWNLLNHAEHDREMALRDELSRVERLEQLAANFHKKAAMRLCWLDENLQLIAQNPAECDYVTTLANCKKHEAIAADINLYLPRIDALANLAADLRNGNYSDLERVEQRMDEVRQKWCQLNQALQVRGDKLQVYCKLQQLQQRMHDLHEQIVFLTQRIVDSSSDCEQVASVAAVEMLRNTCLNVRSEADALGELVQLCNEEVQEQVVSARYFDLRLPANYVPIAAQVFEVRLAELNDALQHLRQVLAARVQLLNTVHSRWSFVEMVDDETCALLAEIELVFQQNHIAVRHTSGKASLSCLAKRIHELYAAVECKQRRAAELALLAAPFDAQARTYVDAYSQRVEALRVEILSVRDECAEKLAFARFVDDISDLRTELDTLLMLVRECSSLQIASMRARVEPLASQFEALCAHPCASLASDQLEAVRIQLAALNQSLKPVLVNDCDRLTHLNEQFNSLETAVALHEAKFQRTDVDTRNFDGCTPFEEVTFYIDKMNQFMPAITLLRHQLLALHVAPLNETLLVNSRFAAVTRRLDFLEQATAKRLADLDALLAAAQLALDLQDVTVELSSKLLVVNSHSTHLAALRAANTAERDMKPVELQLLQLTERVQSLSTRLSSEHRSALVDKFGRVNSLWNQLLAALRARHERVKDSLQLERLTLDLDAFAEWLQRTSAACDLDTDLNAVAAVDARLQTHATLQLDITVRLREFQEGLLPFGRRVVHDDAQLDDPRYLTLRQRLCCLENDAAQLNTRWQDKQRSLTKQLALLLFANDAQLIESALGRLDDHLVRIAQHRPLAVVQCDEMLRQLDTIGCTVADPLDLRLELLHIAVQKLPVLDADEHCRVQETLTRFTERRGRQSLAVSSLRYSLQSSQRYFSLLDECVDLEDWFSEKRRIVDNMNVPSSGQKQSSFEASRRIACLRAIENELVANAPRLDHVAADVANFVHDLQSEPHRESLTDIINTEVLETRVSTARCLLLDVLTDCRDKQAALMSASQNVQCVRYSSLQQTEKWIASVQTQLAVCLPLADHTPEAIYCPSSCSTDPLMFAPTSNADCKNSQSQSSEPAEAASASASASAPARVRTDSIEVYTVNISQRHLSKLIRQQENIEIHLRVRLQEMQLSDQTHLLNLEASDLHAERRLLEAFDKRLQKNRCLLELLKQLKQFESVLDLSNGWLDDCESTLRVLVTRLAHEPMQIGASSPYVAHQLVDMLTARVTRLHADVDSRWLAAVELTDAIHAWRLANQSSFGEKLRSKVDEVEERAEALLSAYGAFQRRVDHLVAHLLRVSRTYFVCIADLCELRETLDEQTSLVEQLRMQTGTQDEKRPKRVKTERLLNGAPVVSALAQHAEVDCDPYQIVLGEPTLSLAALVVRRRRMERELRRLVELDVELSVLRHDRLQHDLSEQCNLVQLTVNELAHVGCECPFQLDPALPLRLLDDLMQRARKLADTIAARRALLTEAILHTSNEYSLVELIEWLQERIAVAKQAHETATCLQQACLALDSFNHFELHTSAFAREQVPCKIRACRRILADASERSTTTFAARTLYAAYIELLEELHSDLLELLATKKHFLQTQLERFTFLDACSALTNTMQSYMASCLHQQPDVHSEQNSCRQVLLTVMENLHCIGEQVDALSQQYHLLAPAYSAAPLQLITSEYEKLVAAWRALQQAVNCCLQSSDSNGPLAHFLELVSQFTCWCDTTLADMLQHRPTLLTVRHVHAVLSKHVSDACKYAQQDPAYRACLRAGFNLIRAKHKQTELVKLKLVQVADRYFDVRDLLQTERLRLLRLVDVASFMQNASNAAHWLSKHEVIFNQQHRDDAEAKDLSLEEIERLLLTQNTLERSLALERYLFERIESLTQLELELNKSADVVQAERIERRECFIHSDVFAELSRIEQQQQLTVSSPAMQEIVTAQLPCDTNVVVDPQPITPPVSHTDQRTVWSGWLMCKQTKQEHNRRATDRSWKTVYCVIDPIACTLSFLKLAKSATTPDFRKTPEQSVAVSLCRAIVQPTEYKHRRYVLSITIHNGASYLLQCKTQDEVTDLLRPLETASQTHRSSSPTTSIEVYDNQSACDAVGSATLPRTLRPNSSTWGASLTRRWTLFNQRRKQDKKTMRSVSMLEKAQKEA